MNVLDFSKKKRNQQKVTMVTSYDYWSAAALNETDVDCLLVGDSLAMVMHGHSTTVTATTEMMALHTQAVAKGAPNKFIVGDMPFLSFRKGLSVAMDTVDQLMKAGAHSVKLEGIDGHETVVEQIVKSGVPVMGHLGLTPQSIHQFGGFKVQGKSSAQADHMVGQALKLQELGAFAVVLECVPTELARTITQKLEIPTIGIGAGPVTDGQVLVFQDLLGLSSGFKPKFLRTYLNGFEQIQSAVNRFHQDVNQGAFPTEKESYS